MKTTRMMNEPDEKMIEENKELIEKYPFLAVKSYDFDNDVYYIPANYDYSCTWLDGMPDGWRIAFAESMCDELKEALEECDYVDKYIIMDVKEKYGTLRIYDTGVPDGCRVPYILKKYEIMSWGTCYICGAKVTKTPSGFISPWCDECASKMKFKYKEKA